MRLHENELARPGVDYGGFRHGEFCPRPAWMAAFKYMSGLRSPSGFGVAMRARNVRVSALTIESTARTVP